jgi:hypothetical protein
LPPGTEESPPIVVDAPVIRGLVVVIVVVVVVVVVDGELGDELTIIGGSVGGGVGVVDK